jgi:isopenicillin-N N-acyltransferase-like protein
MPFPYIEVSGTPFQMGMQHGRQAAGQVRGFAEYLISAARTAGDDRSPEELRRAVLLGTHRFLPWFEQYCPTVLEEVRGLAEGAELTLEEALLLQIRGEIVPALGGEGCTSYAVTARGTSTGGILAGQTSDMEPAMEQHFLVLHVAPNGGPRAVMWTFAGQLGYHGLNEHGVAHFANSVYGGPPSPRGMPGGLPHYPVKRRLYECRTRSEVMAHWEALPVCSSGNYMLAAGDPAIFDVEVTPAGVALIEEGGAGFLAHANHFLSPRFRTPATDSASLPDSFGRQERMTELLQSHLGQIGVEEMKAFLSDHVHHPCSICRHEEPGPGKMVTMAGLIAEPQFGRLHVSRGNPCGGDWACYSV